MHRTRFGRPVEKASRGPLSAPILPPAMAPDVPRRPLRAGPFGVLDVGSTKICCMIGRVDQDGAMRVLGFGMFASRGVRLGSIVDIDEAERAIRKAVADAEEMAQYHLRAVTVNLGCGQPASRMVNVQWPVAGRAVTETDIRRVLAEARARAQHEGRNTVHVVPLGFDVDETPGAADPRGLYCDHLTARLHTVDASSTALRNLVTAVERCELDVAELVSGPIASGLSTLVEDERHLGATVIDMGGGTTDLAVFNEGQVIHTAQVALGGNHVTHDVARLLSTPVAHAERLKTLYGNAQGSPDDEREMLPVPLVGEEEHQIHRVPRSQLVAIIRPRLEETFEMVREKLDRAGLARESGRVVLTGGASQLVGAREMAAQILDRQVRLGRPSTLRGLVDHDGPAFATAAGLLAWSSGVGRPLSDIEAGDDAPPGPVRRFINFIRDRM